MASLWNDLQQKYRSHTASKDEEALYQKWGKALKRPWQPTTTKTAKAVIEEDFTIGRLLYLFFHTGGASIIRSVSLRRIFDKLPEHR